MYGRRYQRKRSFKRVVVTLLAFVMLVSVLMPGLTASAGSMETDPTDATTIPVVTESEETTEVTEVEETEEETEPEETTEETEPAQDPAITALYEQIMSYTDAESYWEFVGTMTDEEFEALLNQFTEEQQNAFWDHVDQLTNEEQIDYAASAEDLYNQLIDTDNFNDLMTALNSLTDAEKGFLQSFDGDQIAALDAHISSLDKSQFASVGLTIKETIANDGCMSVTPSVTTTGITYVYTWQKNGTPIERTGYDTDGNADTIEFYSTDENGTWVNAALLQGTAADAGEAVKYSVQLTGVKIDDLRGTALDKVYSVNNNNVAEKDSPYFAELKNGSFEDPNVPRQTFEPENTPGLYWQTTDNNNQIEIINKAEDRTRNDERAGLEGYYFSYTNVNNNINHDVFWHGVIEMADGDQAAEINANSAGALYQDVITIPGVEMHWQVAHMGRPVTNGKMQGDYGTDVSDTMYVVIMSTKMAQGTGNNSAIDSSAEVNDVINNPGRYPGAVVVNIKYTWVWRRLPDNDPNFPRGDRMYRVDTVNGQRVETPIYTLYGGRLYQHNEAWVTYSTDSDIATLEKYVVPEDQYATRFFFVAGPTVGGETQGNHVDNIWFSQSAVPITQGKANLTIEKTLKGLTSEADINAAKAGLSFTVSVNGVNRTVTGNQLTWNGNVGTYTVPSNFYTSSVGFTVTETVNSIDNYNLTSTAVTSTDNVTVVNSEQKSASGTLTKGETEKISFTNTYTPATTSVKISKDVKGNMGDWSKNFKFTVALSGGTFSGSSYMITDKDNVSKDPVVITDGTTSVEISLKHGESVEITKVPIGATLTVTESDYANYTVKTEVTNATDSDELNTDSDVSFKVPSAVVTVAYTNTNNATIDTGISMDSMPYIVLISVAAASAFVLLLNKRRYTGKY